MKKSLLLLFLLLSGCHPFFMFKPAALTKASKATPGIEVAIDNYGIPYIKAKTTREAIYGLGFMHARDRLFQLDLIRHAALGKTSELLGERGLDFDRRLRILSYRLDEQLLSLSDEENQTIDTYLKGVNDGAKKRGKSAEHFLLGTSFKDLTKREVVAIARLQSWQLGADLFAEITRLKIARSHIPDNEKVAFISAMDDQGVAIIAQSESHAQWIWPSYLSAKKSREHTVDKLSPLFGDGASNAWAVKSTLMDDQFATLMNDPHLQHNWPSNFYLATIESDDLFATGASFVGLPGIVIGGSRHVSWGVTASALNTQDAVLLKTDKSGGHTYVVDGKTLTLESWPQKYCVKDKCLEEMRYVSIFGPVIDHEMDQWIDKGDVFALQWTGFNVDQHHILSSGFFNLARAKNIKEAMSTVQAMTLPGVNLVLADTKGDIAYSYAGLVPKRDPSQNPYLPLNGTLSSSLWSSFLEKPSLLNPPKGYIITANQNIYSANAAHGQYGQQGAPAYRAVRIDQRINDMQKTGPLNFLELSKVQLDESSSEAKELAPIIGNMCLVLAKDKAQKTFAETVAAFDGAYTTKSIGALPYEFLLDEVVKAQLAPILGTDALGPGQYLRQPSYVIKRALAKHGFDDKSEPKLKKACDLAYKRLIDKAGSKTWAWRWGRHHYLARQSILAEAPVVGKLFKDKRREVAGSLSSPMAEVGLPVKYGANLRLKVKMTSPPEIYAVLDSGNSGTVGDAHAFDQAKLWHEGGFIALPTDWSKTKEWNRFQLE